MEEVRRIRHERGLSQQALADLANVNKVTLVRIESGTGNPNVETLEKLADALGVEIGEFFPKAQASLPFEEYTGHRRNVLEALKPLLAYMKQRASEYEEEVIDENSPYFRNPDAAAHWVEDLDKEARGLSGLLIEEARPHFKGSMTTKEKGSTAVELLRYIAKLFEVRNRAEKRSAAMSGVPDQLASKRKKGKDPGAPTEVQEYQHRLLDAIG